MPETTKTARPGAATLALAAAGLIALVAVGTAIMRSSGGGESANEAAPSNGQQAATIEETIAQVRQRLQQDPDNDQGWFTLGVLLRGSGDAGGAQRAFRRAMELRPNNADYVGYLAESLLLASSGAPPPEAERLFRRALEIEPGHPQARYYLATMRDMRGDHRGALDDLVALLRTAPADAPWAPQVREAAERIAQVNGIDIAGRLPAAPPPSTATAGIPGPTREQLEAARGIPPGQQNEMARGMVDRLAARLAADPRDADGWIMLMRSRMMLNEPERAREALTTGLAAFAGDSGAQQRLRDAAQTLNVPSQ
ncbi:MAG TPA: tetratricopeptide repeat protein [Allosphingosinicella sp.]|nr:tetratricopeptide repeat protein [Allosphingosinicella sp.]